MVHSHHPKVTPRRGGNLFHLALCCLCFNVAFTGDALADHLPNTCSGGSCTFFDILNSPLGSATLSLDGEQLVISNIGGSGQDGVIQSPLDSLFMRTTLASPNFSGSVLGSIAEIRQVGVADGVPGTELMLTKIVNFGGTGSAQPEPPMVKGSPAMPQLGSTVNTCASTGVIGNIKNPSSTNET